MQHLCFHHIVFFRVGSERRRGIDLKQPGLEILIDDHVVAWYYNKEEIGVEWVMFGLGLGFGVNWCVRVGRMRHEDAKVSAEDNGGRYHML